MNIYLFLNNQQVGPYSIKQLQQLLVDQDIPGNTPAWREGLTEWIEVSSLLSSDQAADQRLPLRKDVSVAPNTNRVQSGVIANKSSRLSRLTLSIIIIVVLSAVVLALWIHPHPLADLTTTISQTAQIVSSPDPIKTVQNGVLPIDPSVQIGPAIKGYKYFDHVEWTSFSDPQGRTIVECIAKVDVASLHKGNSSIPDSADERMKGVDFTYTIQFLMSKSALDQFQVGYSGYVLKNSYNNFNQEYPDHLHIGYITSDGLTDIYSNKLPNILSFVNFWQSPPAPQSVQEQSSSEDTNRAIVTP